jgi:hypothetical protein
METGLLVAASRLSDRELLRRVVALAGHERRATVELVAHLAELDKRKLYQGEGYRSLFVYCVEALRLAEHSTYKRIAAARACRRFPVLLDHLGDGSLNLTTLRLIAPHLTRKNLTAVVGEAAGRRKREVQALVARLAPRPDVSPSVRKLPAKPVLVVSNPLAAAQASEDSPRPGTDDGPALVLPAPPPPSPPVTALAPGRYRVQFTVAAETQDTLRQVQALLRREIPDGDLATIFARALKLLLAETARKKLAATEHPRQRPRARDLRSRHKPAELVRAVWERDAGRCAFVAKNGHRCGEESFLEFHHLEAYALGGEMTEENISLRCHTHNQYEAALLFGPYVPKVRERGPAYVSSNGPMSQAPRKELRRTGPGASSVAEQRAERAPASRRGWRPPRRRRGVPDARP